MSRHDDKTAAVQVAVRVRPFLPSEDGARCIEVSSKENVVRIGGDRTFTFDHALPESTSQSYVYEKCVAPLMVECLAGYNATVLAYGQTGSGKTFTVIGSTNTQGQGDSDDSSVGVIPRCLHDLYGRLESKAATVPGYSYEVRVQFLELYGEEIRDLLTPMSGRSLLIRDGGLGAGEPEVIGATETTVSSAQEALLCLYRGGMRRVTGATQMNTESSRSHAIMTVIVEQTLSSPSDDDDDGYTDEEIVRSKFHFVDLAGSERQKRTGAVGQRLKEGIDINKGLLVLGNVISALVKSQKSKVHVPYRDSKLTRLLQGSLGGNHKTLMVACVSPSSINMEESINCLRYANRAKNIVNVASVNIDPISRAVAEWKSKCQGLASELLRLRETFEVKDGPYTDEILRVMAEGDGKAKEKGISNTSTPQKEVKQQLQDVEAEAELNIMRETCREYRNKLKTMSEYFYRMKAEKEYYRQQVEGGGDEGEEESTDVAVARETVPKALFVEKIAAYEKEIAFLRDGNNSNNDNNNNGSEKTLATEMPAGEDPAVPSVKSDMFTSTGTMMMDDDDHHEDEEEDEEKRRLDIMSKKYLAKDFDAPTSEQDTTTDEEKEQTHSPLSSNVDINVLLEEKDALHTNRQKYLDAHIVELTRNISEKEDLIDQLKASQGKYEVMRGFYEDKLQQMGSQIKTMEQEQEQLKLELQQVEKSKKKSKRESAGKLKKELDEKDKRIAFLKKQQAELSSLTKVSTRNLSIMNRLQDDISEMKKQKNDLQRQVLQDRKAHNQEIQRLKVEATFREREVSKWKQKSEKNASLASNAQRVAKTRYKEITTLKKKQKEAEKRLLRQTVKIGALERVGVDATMVGRSNRSRKGRKASSEMNTDQVRKFLGGKISDVVRMEMIAEKVANEWEEHLQLIQRQEDILELVHSDNNGTSNNWSEELDAVGVQIKYKENRIRKLTSKLSAKPFVKSSNKSSSSKQPSVLDDNKFIALSAGTSPLAAAETTCKVLFGMVVRERRRVSNLVRTACSLDMKSMANEKLLQSKDEAFRTYVEEQKDEKARMARQHQSDILSLMSTLSQEKNGQDSDGFKALEYEIMELQKYKEEADKFKKELDDAKNIIKLKNVECNKLEEEIKEVRSNLHYEDDERRENDDSQEENGNNEDYDHEDVSNKIKDGSPQRKKMSVRGKGLSARNQKIRNSSILSIIESSDEDEDEDMPDWAKDIKGDLALIADGEMPLSLSTGHGSFRASSDPSDSVFSRLSDPQNFTGVQKQRVSLPLMPSDHRPRSSKRGNKSLPGSPINTVYDRLMDPANFTGVQKNIFDRNEKKLNRSRRSLSSVSRNK